MRDRAGLVLLMVALAMLVAAVAASALPSRMPAAAPPSDAGMASVAVRPAHPVRVASLNLCTDELALLLAAPGQLVSISRLGGDPAETTVAGRAGAVARNRGRITDVVALNPDLVLTSGGDANAAATTRRLGIAVVEVLQPRSLADVRANVRTVAAAMGRAGAGEALIARMNADIGPRPAATRTALMVGGGGVTVAADGLAAQWLRHAGLVQQAVPQGRIDLDRLLERPPRVLVVARYRPGQASANQAWLAHPALAALPADVRRIDTDGRVWTCAGPPVAAEIALIRQRVVTERR